MSKIKITAKTKEEILETLTAADDIYHEKVQGYEAEIESLQAKLAELGAEAAEASDDEAAELFNEYSKTKVALEFSKSRKAAYLAKYPDLRAYRLKNPEVTEIAKGIDKAAMKRIEDLHGETGELAEEITAKKQALLDTKADITALVGEIGTAKILAETARDYLSPEDRCARVNLPNFGHIHSAFNCKITIPHTWGGGYWKNEELSKSVELREVHMADNSGEPVQPVQQQQPAPGAYPVHFMDDLEDIDQEVA